MKERPILFSGVMVNAILEGRKTMTRRVMVPQPVETLPRVEKGKIEAPSGDAWDLEYLRGWVWQMSQAFRCYSAGGEREFKASMANSRLCPYGFALAGDRLWVRERQRVIEVDCIDSRVRVRYEADGAESGWLDYPSRLKGEPIVGKCLSYGGFRESSRISLEVTGVRVERLQDISEEDANREGVDSPVTCDIDTTARNSFATLWDNINAARGYSWESNPWVWVVEFRRAA